MATERRDVRCCESIPSAAIFAPCTPPSVNRLFGDAAPVVTVTVVPVPLPQTALVLSRHYHSAIPPGSGLRLLNTTVLRI